MRHYLIYYNQMIHLILDTPRDRELKSVGVLMKKYIQIRKHGKKVVVGFYQMRKRYCWRNRVGDTYKEDIDSWYCRAAEERSGNRYR